MTKEFGAVKIAEKDLGWKEIQQRINQASKKEVAVGFMGHSGELKKATIHEFGGTIKHPGGTAYGFKTKRDLKNNKIKFLKNGKGIVELGRTGPHDIDIPERSFMRSTYDRVHDKMRKLSAELLNQVIYDNLEPKVAMTRLGHVFQNEVRGTISRGEADGPALSAATIKAKGSSTKLLDTGKMQGAIKVQVRQVKR